MKVFVLLTGDEGSDDGAYFFTAGIYSSAEKARAAAIAARECGAEHCMVAEVMVDTPPSAELLSEAEDCW